MTEQRRLAAILVADVVGYSKLVGNDEAGTLAQLQSLRIDVIEPQLATHAGRLFKAVGDGFLVEFASAVQAVSCAKAIQEANTPGALSLRIGIHLGDVVVQGDDLMGDGVNVAARIEGIAEPGGIALSRAVHEQVRDKLDLPFVDKGEMELKNIARPVHVWRWSPGSAVSTVTASAVLPLPDKPSIAVLPFQNMSGDPEQQYFADGMVEEIITALSRFKSLFVIARNSSFTFKGKAVDIKEVGRSLGVRYVLEGSVRKASGKVRITGQLIDAATGAHLWADRFERDLTDIFALQDEVTVAVVSAIQPRLLQTEIAMATRRQPNNLTAYDIYLRALPHYHLTTREGIAEAAKLAHRALELDPRFGCFAALAGACHQLNVIHGYAIDPQFDRTEAVRLLRLALRLDGDDSDTLAMAASVSAYMVGDSESEIEMADRAVALNPNSYRVWSNRGWVYKVAGLHEEAVQSFKHAIRMSPMDPALHQTLCGMGLAFIELRRFDEAVVAGKRSVRHNISFSSAYRCLASAFAHLGRNAEAREAAARLLEVDPAFTISAWIARGGQSNAKLVIEGLRKAGLPE
jgi:adenylate cyclase